MVDSIGVIQSPFEGGKWVVVELIEYYQCSSSSTLDFGSVRKAAEVILVCYGLMGVFKVGHELVVGKTRSKRWFLKAYHPGYVPFLDWRRKGVGER